MYDESSTAVRRYRSSPATRFPIELEVLIRQLESRRALRFLAFHAMSATAWVVLAATLGVAF